MITIKKLILVMRQIVQVVFFVGLTTSLISGFMGIWPVTLIVVFFLAAIFGNFYCGWICPFGSLQEWFGKLGALFIKKKLHMPRKLQQVLQFSKYVLYGLILLSGVTEILSSLSQTGAFNANFHFLSIVSTENFANLKSFTIIPIIIFILFYLAISLIFDRPFCNYLCPDSINYGLLSFMRIFTIKRNQKSCINCKKCNKVCPMQIDVAKTINLRNANCINCMECIAICPVKKTLNFGLCINKENFDFSNKHG